MDRARRHVLLEFCLLTLTVCGCTRGSKVEYSLYVPAAAESEPTASAPAADADPFAAPPDASEPAATGPNDAQSMTSNGTPEVDGLASSEPADAAAVEVPNAAPPSTEVPKGVPDAAAGNGAPDSNAADGTLLAAVGATDAAVAAKPREIKLLVPDKTFRVEGPEGALRVSYDDLDLLKVLNMEPVTADAPDHLPQWLKDLEGKRIRLRGYMRPGELSEKLPFFVLARDTQACCFGPNTKPYDIIPVIMRKGVTTDYIHLRPFDLVGVFHINVEMDLDDASKVEFLYYIDDAVVIQN